MGDSCQESDKEKHILAPLCMHLPTPWGGKHSRIQFVDGAHGVEDANECVVTKARGTQVVDVGLAVQLGSVLPIVHRPSGAAGNRKCTGVGDIARRATTTWGTSYNHIRTLNFPNAYQTCASQKFRDWRVPARTPCKSPHLSAAWQPLVRERSNPRPTGRQTPRAQESAEKHAIHEQRSMSLTTHPHGNRKVPKQFMSSSSYPSPHTPPREQKGAEKHAVHEQHVTAVLDHNVAVVQGQQEHPRRH